MSLSSLLLELSLTRLFSVVLFYHFAFLAISIALLGLGAGGVCAYLGRGTLARWPTQNLGAAASAVNAVAVFVTLEIVLHVPVALDLTVANFSRLSVIYLASAGPFFLTGLVFSTVFAREGNRVAPLYAADLLGGAGACLAVVPLLNWLGGPNTILFAALGMAAASAIWAEAPKLRAGAWLLAGVLIVLIAANHSGKLVDVIYTKGFRQRPVEFVRWNAISRVGVIAEQDGSKWASIDADANTAIMNLDLRDWPGSETEHRMMQEAPALVSLLRPHGAYAIIGPGGGVDVLRALAGGSPAVTGIEINPLIATTIMRDKYAEYARHLYQLPQVHIEVSDGRSWIRGSRQRFDVVQMTLVDTWASTAAGAFALSENNLYTVEAFQNYFEHLAPDGLIAVTRWEFRRPREALRVVSVAMEALRRLGINDSARHFIVVAQGPLLEDGIPVLVLVKKSPFTAEEENVVQAHLQRTPRLHALYLPGVPSASPFSALILSRDPLAFANGYEFNVQPVTDNAPFFFFTMKLRQMARGDLRSGIDWKVNVGVAVLGMVLLVSILAVVAFLILPLWFARVPAHVPGRTTGILYFIALGLGYILAEIAFIQRFVLFLGHPTYALTVVVFLMLLSSGLGSLTSRRWLPDLQLACVPLLLIAAALLSYLIVLPHVLTGLVGQAFWLKLLLSAALLAPPGFVMGMPFPTGLRALHGAGGKTVEWAWAMNAASSVLGSVLAMVIAIQWGLQITLLCSACSYFAAIILAVAGSQWSDRAVGSDQWSVASRQGNG
jgi:spermidine synthase